MSFKSELYVKMFTDMMSEGFIAIDNEGVIQVYNSKAKEIFGINQEQQFQHSKGKINIGDIVIIGDNVIGQDDGKLNWRTLDILGIKDEKIIEGQAIVAIGVYGNNKEVKPIYKTLSKSHGKESLVLQTNFLDIDIKIEIDFVHKKILIKVREEEYIMNYLNAIGHMVVLDGSSKMMKFYQAQGYTARGESINELLQGKGFRAKGKDTGILDVLGRNISEIHKSDSIIQQFIQIAKGEDISYVDKFEEINGIPTMCTLLPVNIQGKRVGAALKVEDISQIKRIIAERDDAIYKLEKAESQLLDEDTINKAFPNFKGNSFQIQNVKRMALKASKTNSNVLILGESGTGKSVLARSIHENSKLRNKQFITVNCGAIPENLLESELFGYEKGAFTGARSEGKKGLFELANGGTIFLDEIGDISLNLQVKLLQVIQDKSFYRVGGIEKIEVNTRIIAATNKSLEEEMTKGRFREDLYYRINVFPIWIPPLRERKQDIIPLIELLLPKICNEIGCKVKRISAEATNLILKYDWPGNIRELENILERAVNLAEGNNLLSKHITTGVSKTENKSEEIKTLKEFIEEQEIIAIENALSHHKGDKKKAMGSLNISKTTFYDKLKKYNIK